jgi:hypothetical protein
MITRLPQLVLLALLIAGCTHRLTLDDHLFRAQVRDADDRSELRVYLDRRVVIVRPPLEKSKTPTDRRGHLEDQRHGKRIILGRGVPGEIIGLDTHAGLARLWVSFDRTCSARDCAFAFIAADDGGAFRLAKVPPDARFRPAQIHARGLGRRWRLTPGRIHSLAESVPVYRSRAYGRRPVVVQLELVVDRRDQLETERLGGRERPGAAAKDPPSPE